MNSDRDPPRLLRGRGAGPGGLARALLAARERGASEAVIAAVAARLPAGPPGETDGGPPGSGGPASLPSGSAPLALSTASPWSGLLVGAVLGAVVGAASLWLPVAIPPPPRPVAAEPSVASALLLAATAPLGRPSDPPAASGGERPRSSAAARTSGPADSLLSAASESAATPLSPASVTAPLAETEADYLRRAQGQMSAAPAQALALAEAHPLRYPDGRLGQEREMIAIGALAGLGRSAEARARAEVFLALFPSSAHRRRLLVLVPAATAAEKPEP